MIVWEPDNERLKKVIRKISLVLFKIMDDTFETIIRRNK